MAYELKRHERAATKLYRTESKYPRKIEEQGGKVCCRKRRMRMSPLAGTLDRGDRTANQTLREDTDILNA